MRHRIDDRLYMIYMLELVLGGWMTISNRRHDVNLRLVVVIEEIPVDGRACWRDVSLVTVGDGGGELKSSVAMSQLSG
jgi:hypothetical protein